MALMSGSAGVLSIACILLLISVIIASLDLEPDLNAFKDELDLLLSSPTQEEANELAVMLEEPTETANFSSSFNLPLVGVGDKLRLFNQQNKFLIPAPQKNRPRKKIRNRHFEQPPLREGAISSTFGSKSPLRGIASPQMLFDDFLNPEMLKYIEEHLPEIKHCTKDFDDLGVSLYKTSSTLSEAQNSLGQTNQLSEPMRFCHNNNAESEALKVPGGADGHVYGIKRVRKFLDELNQWLVYIHDLLISHNILTKDPENRSYDRGKLMQWLHGEVFEPPTGLAILRPTPQERPIENGQVGSIQFWIRNGLESQVSKCETSVAILGIWYKTNDYNGWEKQFRSDEYFWLRVKRTLLKHLPTGISEGSTSFLGPGSHNFNEFKVKFVLKYQEVASMVKHQRAEGNKIIENLGIFISFHRKKKICFLRSFRTQRKPQGLKIQQREILKFWSSFFFHSREKIEIMFTQDQKGQVEVIQGQFMNWIFEIYYGIKYPLPMFGPIDIEIFNSLICHRLQFHELQIILFQAFLKDSKATCKKASLKALEFWLTIFHPSIWVNFSGVNS